MEEFKKNPVLMGIASAVGCALVLLAIDFVLGLITKKPFATRISDPISIAILIIGPIACGISTWKKVKEKAEGKEKKEL